MAGRVVSGLAWTTVSSVVRNIVALLQIAILTRFLDKADFGIIAIAQLFVSFTTLFLDMGVSAGIIHRQNISNKEYSSLFWLNIFLGIGLTTILFVLSPLLTSQYHSEDLTNIAKIICFTILVSAIGTQQRTYCQKMTYFKRMAVIESAGSLVTFIVALCTAMQGYGVYSLAYSTLAGSIVTNLTYFVVGTIKDHRISFHFSLKETIAFLKIGIYQVGSSILDFFTRELDILIVSATLGLEFLGVYNIAKRIPMALFSFIQPIISRVYTPLLAEINHNRDLLKANYMKMSKSLSWFSFPMYFLVAALSPTILTVVFGREYIEGVPVMMVFCFRLAFSGVNGVCGALQVATGRTDIGFKWTIYSIASTALIYYLSAQWGITAFLIGMLFIVVVNVFVVWLMQFKPMTNVSWREYLLIYTNSFLICLVLSTVAYCIYSGSSLVYALIAAVLYIALYCILIINSRDGESLISVINSLPMPSFIKQAVFMIQVKK